MTPICRSLNLLYGPFRAHLEHGLKLARQTGLQVHVFESWRSFDRQADLYAQGRTAPGAVVTRARPGESWHHYGVAVDLVFDGDEKPGVQWSWDGDYVGSRTSDYADLGKILTIAGLTWYGEPGSGFYEKPHFQMTFGLTIQDAQRLFRQGGLPAVWLELDKRAK